VERDGAKPWSRPGLLVIIERPILEDLVPRSFILSIYGFCLLMLILLNSILLSLIGGPAIGTDPNPVPYLHHLQIDLVLLRFDARALSYSIV
jgi:hypothetical protein